MTRPSVALIGPPSFSLRVRSGAMLLDAPADGGVERLVFLQRLLDPQAGLQFHPLGAALVGLGIDLLRHRLGLPAHLLEQRGHPFEALVALDREMERLRVERLVAGVEEGDRRRALAEMAPRRLDDLALPPRLAGSRRGGRPAFAKDHRAARRARRLSRIGIGGHGCCSRMRKRERHVSQPLAPTRALPAMINIWGARRRITSWTRRVSP